MIAWIGAEKRFGSLGSCFYTSRGLEALGGIVQVSVWRADDGDCFLKWDKPHCQGTAKREEGDLKSQLGSQGWRKVDGR